ncbi:hypothetical protein BDN71DRAFT_525759 [Pleurotus eryngii]|uniref:Uncharacterized protein n=1 Tax=Pleurotus eryngii TaxID=5323 RepID=A0A9P5ZHH5_PLEER|nr:hypothetical protein BDN71DRAFT_525759 [Pleurotus eryngii]
MVESRPTTTWTPVDVMLLSEQWAYNPSRPPAFVRTYMHFMHVQMDDELNHLDKPLLRITSLPNDPPLLNDLDGPSEDISPSTLNPLSPSPSPLLVPTGPPLPTILTDTPSPAVQYPNPPHIYTLASAFTFDGAFSIVAPFCDANVKHGLKTAGVCARIWGVKEMVENVVGIKPEDGMIAAKGRNGEENRDLSC